jgi:hypothetical protein
MMALNELRSSARASAVVPSFPISLSEYKWEMTRARNASLLGNHSQKKKKKTCGLSALHLKSSSRNSFASIWGKIALILGLSIPAE